jgi:hypothetical protein
MAAKKTLFLNGMLSESAYARIADQFRIALTLCAKSGRAASHPNAHEKHSARDVYPWPVPQDQCRRDEVVLGIVGEIANVSQAFQPSGLFFESNS